jgi:hypothetical protein
VTGSSTKQAGAPGVRSGTQLSSQEATTMTDETISATTIINAPAEAIFAVRQHTLRKYPAGTLAGHTSSCAW